MLLVLDWNILSGCSLVLSTNEVGNLLILCLFNGRLVVLLALAHDVLLDVINS